MAVSAPVYYNSFKKSVFDSGPTDFQADTIKIALLASTYTPDKDSHEFWDDVSAHEVAGAGYVANGATLAGKSASQDNTYNRGVLDGNDPSWAASTITARYAVKMHWTGVAATSRLVCYWDFGENKITTNETFSIPWHNNGIALHGSGSDYYNSFLTSIFDAGPIDFQADTIRVALLANTYTFDADNHDFWDDVVAHEVAGAGYAAGGATLAGKSATQDNVNDRGLFDADDVTWAASTISARYAQIHKWTGVAATSPLIRCIDLGEDKATAATDFKLNWDANGILALN